MVYFVGEENFLKKAFLPPYPYLSKTLKMGVIFLRLFLCLSVERTNPSLKVFSQVFFKKLAST